ncbi:nitroreductase family protein [Nocardia brasiliensis]|uniref:nitroreductase family protein n=1 Tax=Nocardia brasiliensis TaxID=37326 RepID=UPI00366D97E9
MSTPIMPAPDAQALDPAGIEQFSQCVRTLRSVRRFRRDDVPTALLDFVLDHAVCAGSGSNRQPWRFIVVRDRRLRGELGDWYRDAWRLLENSGYTARPGGSVRASARRITASARYLAEHFEDVPVVVVPCFLPVPRNPVDLFGGASIYPAVQNLLLAARSVGLGTVLTTPHAICALDRTGRPTAHEALYLRLCALLAIPAGVVPAALIPMGWPAETFGPSRRRPAREMTYRDRWAQEWGNVQ